MDHTRIAELHKKLEIEFKNPAPDFKRIAEINHWISKEFAVADPQPQQGSWWDAIFPLPDNWKTYVTMALGAFVAFNTQLHLVPQNVQDAILAAAVSLGFWAVNSTQSLNLSQMKSHLAKLVRKEQ